MIISFSIFFIVFGISAVCVIKRGESLMADLVRDSSVKFIRLIERLIGKEKNLRKLDHAFRMIILIDALKIVKRIFVTHAENERTILSRSTKRAISRAIDKLRVSMQVDVNRVMKEMIDEKDENKKL